LLVDADDERAARRAAAADVEGLEVPSALDLIVTGLPGDLEVGVEHLTTARGTHRMAGTDEASARVDRMLAVDLEPALLDRLPRLPGRGDPEMHHGQDDGQVEQFFASVTPIAVDVSHFERSRRVAVVPGDFPWDDVGTWSALARVRRVDDDGNVTVGAAHAHDARDCILWGEDGPIVADGVSDLVVVRAHGTTLVTTRERAAQLKSLLEALPQDVRELDS